jgi:hypothetical protein
MTGEQITAVLCFAIISASALIAYYLSLRDGWMADDADDWTDDDQDEPNVPIEWK